MKGTINTWKDAICFYGNKFDLRDERIMSMRQTKELYELYYRIDREKINFMYIEKDVYQTIYHLLRLDGWEDILAVKYLSQDDHLPSFLLKAQKNDCLVTYYFDVEKHITLKATVHYKGYEHEDWTTLDGEIKHDLKQIYHIMERYVYTYYKTNLIVDKQLYTFMHQKSKFNKCDNTTLIVDSIINHFHHCLDKLQKTQEYATSTSISIYQKKFDDPVVQAVVWFTLRALNENYALKRKESKDSLLHWLQQECKRAKENLTQEQWEQLQNKGIDYPNED